MSDLDFVLSRDLARELKRRNDIALIVFGKKDGDGRIGLEIHASFDTREELDELIECVRENIDKKLENDDG